MTNIDVSVVLNMHREAPYLRPTLLSLKACAAEAAKAGIKVELIAVFDRADRDTLAVFNQTRLTEFEAVKVTEVDAGSLGVARNAGVDLSKGEYVWTADGDDLVSRNAIVELHKTANANQGNKCAVFVSYLVAFGEQFHVAKYFDSSYLTVADFAYRHPYVSRIFVHRDAFGKHKYSDLRVTSGYAYEDWDFNVRLRRDGFKFLVAENTIFYYRQRAGSLLREADAMSARVIPHTSFFDRDWFLEELDREKEAVGDWLAFVDKRQKTCILNFANELVDSPILCTELINANKLEPEIELSRIESASSYSPVPCDSGHWGYRLAEAFRLIGAGPFTDVVLLPWLNPGGGERYILRILHELVNVNSDSRFLVLCGEPAQRHAWVYKLPRRSVLLDVHNAFPTLNVDDRDRLTMRLLLAVTKPGARLHIKSSIFAHRLIDSYGAVLLRHFAAAYYRFSDERLSWRDIRVDGSGIVKFLRRHLPGFSRVICDCSYIARRDKERIGLAIERYYVLYASTSESLNGWEKAAPAKRLLWASRICDEKRPELLAPLAIRLAKHFPDLIIEAHGHADPDKDPNTLFQAPALVYNGPYDGFESLPLAQYDAFLYTSAFDGMPNVLLEALAAGMPVIAPDVGGIGEAVITGQTGYLVPDEADDVALVEHYVQAIKRLYDDWDATQAMAAAGRALILQRHSPAAFNLRVSQVFGDGHART